MSAAENFAADLQKKVVLIRQTLHNTPGTSDELMEKARSLNGQLEDVIFIFEGPEARASREEILKVELQPVLDKLNSVYEVIKDLNEKLDDIGAPWTPGRIPALK